MGAELRALVSLRRQHPEITGGPERVCGPCHASQWYGRRRMAATSAATKHAVPDCRQPGDARRQCDDLPSLFRAQLSQRTELFTPVSDRLVDQVQQMLPARGGGVLPLDVEPDAGSRTRPCLVEARARVLAGPPPLRGRVRRAAPAVRIEPRLGLVRHGVKIRRSRWLRHVHYPGKGTSGTHRHARRAGEVDAADRRRCGPHRLAPPSRN